MVFHWSLSGCKSTWVSRILLSIMADLNNAAVKMVSTRLLISKSSSPYSNTSVAVPSVPITIGINVTFMFQFFQFTCKIKMFILLFLFFRCSFVVNGDSEVHNFASSLFFWIIIKSGRLAEIKWSVCMSKFQRSLCVSFSGQDVGLGIYHLFV